MIRTTVDLVAFEIIGTLGNYLIFSKLMLGTENGEVGTSDGVPNKTEPKEKTW